MGWSGGRSPSTGDGAQACARQSRLCQANFPAASRRETLPHFNIKRLRRKPFLNGTLIVVMVCSAAPLLPLQPFHSSPSHCILMTRSVRLPACLSACLPSFLCLGRRSRERRRLESDSLMRSAFPLNRQRERMHQLTPTYKQAVDFEMAAILQPLLPPPFHSLF